MPNPAPAASSHKLTQIPGSSAYFLQGLVTYSNEAKISLLGIPAEIIERYGPVSEEVAVKMACGARKLAKSDFGLAVTGIAGPSGGSKEKPVGLVYIALSDKKAFTVKKFIFPGKRENIKERAACAQYLTLAFMQKTGDLLLVGKIKIKSDCLFGVAGSFVFISLWVNYGL